MYYKQEFEKRRLSPNFNSLEYLNSNFLSIKTILQKQ